MKSGISVKFHENGKDWISYAHQTLLFTQTKNKHDKFYRDHAPTISFNRTSTRSAEGSCTPFEVVTLETIGKLHDMILVDGRLKVPENLESIGINHGSVISIEWSLENKKTVHKMGEAFAHNW